MNEMLLMTRRRQLSEVGRFAFPWLVDVAKTFKGRGVFPLSLTDYYQNPDDIVIAGLVETLIPDGQHHDRLIMEILQMLGEHPSEIVRKRLFITMSPPDDDEQWLLIPFLSKRDVVQMLGWIYDNWQGIEQAVLQELSGEHIGTYSLLDIGNNSFSFIQRLHLQIARLTLKDGFGKGLWSFTHTDELQCPLTDDVCWLLRHFYRLEKLTPNNVNEILQYIGFDIPVEFLYTVCGVKEMRRKHRNEIDTFLRGFSEHISTKKLVRYCSGTPYYRSILRKEIPLIGLDI